MTIHWQGNRSDVSAECGEYSLRAWRIGGGQIWLWHVIHCDGQVDNSGRHGRPLKSRATAQRAAERAMNEHINGCDNCSPRGEFYLGMTCPKCNRPFRSVNKSQTEK